MGLTYKARPPPQVLALDLNCAIYHCVHKLQKRIPYAQVIQRRWEEQLIESVVAYIRQLHRIVAPTEMLYIGVDGVAPMAKIKQQRMRRFKSAVQAEEEGRIKAQAKGIPYVAQPRWDTNAITPGTAFMEHLATALHAYQRTNPTQIHVSAADEPGEGEQKIMTWLRSQVTPPNQVVVYGLDADLIVLSMWASETLDIEMDLFREETEFSGGVKSNALGEEQYLYLNIQHLITSLFNTHGKPDQSRQAFVQEFVALMNFLGNDFVPHGMALKIKDEGIEKLLDFFQETIKTPLLKKVGTTVEYDPDTVKTLFQLLADKESAWILRSTKKKLESRIGSTASKEPEDQAMARFNDQPVAWAAETPLVEYVAAEGEERPRLVLRKTWKATYDETALWGADLRVASQQYLDALAWTLAYYAGDPIDTEFYYPWVLPPRYESLVEAMTAGQTLTVPNTRRSPLEATHQLAMVLPQTSFHLLPTSFASLPKSHPHAWPTAWPLFSFGRRFLWECEPLIPLIQPEQMRSWTKK